jgi:L-ribulose-5-phosphate 4-epimerase
MSSIKELQKKVFEANLELVRKNLVIYSFGNVSGIDREKGLIAIKPSGVSYEHLTPETIVLVDLNNNEVKGNLKPSSDTSTHIVLYKNFPEIGGVVHTHSPYATAWAQAKRSLPCLGTTHADYCFGAVPCTDVMTDAAIGRNYELETGHQIIKTFSDNSFSYKDIPMVLVASHGPFTWGSTPKDAVHNSVMLEYLAMMAFHTVTINPEIQAIKQALLNKHYYRKHGNTAYYGQK